MTKETLQFDAQTDKIFQLMIHSLYENKEIFLRELISNASDACDKLRYNSLTNPTLLDNGSKELNITISFNKDAKTLTIKDTGLGMDKEDLKNNLGTIARSGTQNFVESLTGDNSKDNNLIGQFGVGFYSVFMVADKVSVTSTKAGVDATYKWQSEGQDSYTLEQVDTAERGTTITLYMRDDAVEYLDEHRLRHIITTYSNHVSFDIFLDVPNEVEGKQVIDTHKVNEGNAIWAKDKADISEDEYNAFYKSLAMTGDESPFLTIHNKLEGNIEYSNLLFVPSSKPFDLFHPDRDTKVKLYIKKVFIADEKIDLIPRYLRFLRGVVDSTDLPLNISRENVQNSVVLKKIKTSVTKRVLKELKTIANKDYDRYLEFWSNFGAVVKEGLCEAMEPRDEIIEICRFATTHGDKLTSLADYKERMQDGQDAIYYITADNIEAAKNSPQIEALVKDGIEVILLTDSVDEFWVTALHDYQGVSFKSVTRSEQKDEAEEQHQELVEYFKGILGDDVADVRTTTKLSDSPVCLSVAEGAMDIRMERFMVENKQMKESSKKILELNPNHKIIKSIADDLTNKRNANLVKLLFAQANIVEGEAIKDVSEFSRNLNSLIEDNLAA